MIEGTLGLWTCHGPGSWFHRFMQNTPGAYTFPQCVRDHSIQVPLHPSEDIGTLAMSHAFLISTEELLREFLLIIEPSLYNIVKCMTCVSAVESAAS